MKNFTLILFLGGIEVQYQEHMGKHKTKQG